MQRVLVVLPNWYGDTLFATPLLRQLGQLHPKLFVATFGWAQSHDILTHNPWVDRMVDYPERRIRANPVQALGVIARIRAVRCDTALILRKSLSRTVLIALAGVSERVGVDNPKSGWLLTRRVAPPLATIHRAASYLSLLEAVGVAAALEPYEYVVGEEEHQTADERLGFLTGSARAPLVVLHPAANWAHKRWAPQRYAALGDRLVTDLRAQIVITGGPGDVALAESIQQGMRHPAIVLAGRTTLRELAACLERARLVVSNDTGVLHVAAALRRPIVGLYGPTSPGVTGPLGDPQRIVVLHHAQCCPQIPCYDSNHPPHLGMDSISVDEAYNAAQQLLKLEI